MAILSSNGVTQRKNDTMSEYLGGFTKVAVVVGDIDDGLKCWIFKKGLWSYCISRDNLGFKGACIALAI